MKRFGVGCACLLAVVLLFTGCGEEGEAFFSSAEQQAGGVTASSEGSAVLARESASTGYCRVQLVIRDKNGVGAPLKRAEVDQLLAQRGEVQELRAMPPASDPAVEEQNVILNNGECCSEESRYEHWSVVVPVDSNTFLETFSEFGEDYMVQVLRKEAILSPSAPAALKGSVRAQTAEDSSSYNGPPAHDCDTWVADFSVSGQEFSPGDTITASISLNDPYWAPRAYFFCSYADPNSFVVDGAPVPMSNVTQTAAGDYCGRGTHTGYRVLIEGLGAHTVTVKLDPQFSDKYWNAATTNGPGALLYSPGNWSSLSGFVIGPSQRSLSIQNYQANPATFEEMTTFTGSVVASDFTPTNLSWTLQCINKGTGAITRTFTGNGEDVNVEWDGTDSSGERAYGSYNCLLTAICDEGLSATSTVSVTVSTPVPRVKTITSKMVKLVDRNNKNVKTPQYHEDRGRSNPIAVNSSLASPLMNVLLYCNVQGDGDEGTYTIWGEDGSGNIVFAVKPVNFYKNRRKVRVLFPITVPRRIAQHETIRWFFQSKFDSEVRPMPPTDSPIYVILNAPLKPQAKPRTDVLEFAVGKARGTGDDVSALAALTDRIHFGSGFLYDDNGPKTGSWHTTTRDVRGRKMLFRVSDFVDASQPGYEPRGNCQDFSNLVQVCAVAMGIPAEVRRIDCALKTNSVKPVGQEWYRNGLVLSNFHQTAFYNSTIFDPTYQFNVDAPVLPVGVTEAEYEELFWDRSGGGYMEPQEPVIPLSVD